MREDVSEEPIVPLTVSETDSGTDLVTDHVAEGSPEAASPALMGGPEGTAPTTAEPASATEYLGGLLHRLITLLPAAVEQQDAESIYLARTTSRRLSAGLGLIGPLLPRQAKSLRRLIRAVRKTRKTLGTARDEVVMRDRLAHLELGAETRAAAEFVLGYLLPAEADAIEPTARSAARCRKLRARLEKGSEVVTAIAGIDPATLNTHIASGLAERWLAFGTLAELQSVGGASVGGAGGVGGAGVDPHELRLAGKEARYAMELAAAHGFEVSPDLLKRMKQLQDDLGAWHDHFVLAAAIVDRCGGGMSLSRPQTAAMAMKAASESLTTAGADLADFARHYDKHAKTLDSLVTLAAVPKEPTEPIEPMLQQAPDQPIA